MQSSQLDLGVIVRTCDRSGFFLRRALKSITTQTKLPELIVLVDDGMDTIAVDVELSRFDLRGITLRHLTRDSKMQAQPNRSAALNRGVAEITARWISFLDDDDTWNPQFLERVAPLLAAGENRADFGGVVTQATAVHERWKQGAVLEKFRRPFNPDLVVVDLAALAAGNRFTLNSMVVRRDVFDAVGKYREDLPVLEDWEFNVRAAAKFHFEVIPDALVCYHLRPAGDSMANSPIDEHRRVMARIRNEWLRADLAAGRLGLGQLALAGEIRGLGAVLDFCRRWRDRIRRWLGRAAR